MPSTIDYRELTGSETIVAPSMPFRPIVKDLSLDHLKSSSDEQAEINENSDEETEIKAEKIESSIDIDNQNEDHAQLNDGESAPSITSPSGIWHRIRNGADNKAKKPSGVTEEHFDLVQEHVERLVDSLNIKLRGVRRLYMTDAITGKKFDITFEFKQEGKVWHIQSRHKSLLNNRTFPLISLFYKPNSKRPKLIWRGLYVEGLREVLITEESLEKAFKAYLERCMDMSPSTFNVYGKHIPRDKNAIQ